MKLATPDKTKKVHDEVKKKFQENQSLKIMFSSYQSVAMLAVIEYLLNLDNETMYSAFADEE